MESEASTYTRKALPKGVAATPASITRTDDLRSEKTREPAGVALFSAGTTRTDPARTTSPEPAVGNCRALAAGIEYVIVKAGNDRPDESVNCNVPDIALSVGFTRRNVVAQPPPSAKCGNTT